MLRGSSCFSLCLAVVLESFSLSPSGAFFTLAARSPSLRWTKGHSRLLSIDFFGEVRRTKGRSYRKLCRSGNALSCNCNKEVDRRSLQGSVHVLLLSSGCGESCRRLADSVFAVVYLLFPCLFRSSRLNALLRLLNTRLWIPTAWFLLFALYFTESFLLLVFQKVDHRFSSALFR